MTVGMDRGYWVRTEWTGVEESGEGRACLVGCGSELTAGVRPTTCVGTEAPLRSIYGEFSNTVGIPCGKRFKTRDLTRRLM